MRRWLATLLLLPLAVAGSSDAPEITDPEGDSATGIGDIIAAWFEPTSGTTVDVVVQLAELTQQDPLRIDATWDITGPFDGQPETGCGAVLWLTASGTRAEQRGPGANGDLLLHEVTYGSPGEVRLQGVWTGGRAWGGGALSNFQVSVHPSAPTDAMLPIASLNAPLDDAGPGDIFQAPLGGAGAFEPWNFTGAKRLTSPVELDTPGPVDLTGLWLSRNGTGFDLTAEVRSMTPTEVAACERLRVHVNVGGYPSTGTSAGGTSYLTFNDGWIEYESHDFEADRHRDFDTIGTQPFPYEVRWTLATPGYFQLHARDVSVDLDAPPSISIYCGDLNDRIFDQFSFGDIFGDGAPLVLPIFFVTVATVVGTVLVKKRKDRR